MKIHLAGLLSSLVSIFLAPSLSSAQTLLCERNPITVYYVSYKNSSAKDTDEWKIYLDIENRGTVDVYYRVKVEKLLQPGLPIIPSFLTVTVLNATDAYAGEKFFVHGTTLPVQSSKDSTAIYKVKTKRYYKFITTRTLKGEAPRLSGEFTSILLPLEEIRKWKPDKLD